MVCGFIDMIWVSGMAQSQIRRLESRRPSLQAPIGQGSFYCCPYKGGKEDFSSLLKNAL